MVALTPSERRGALTLVVLLLIGAGHDLWRARTRAIGPAPPGAAPRPAPDHAPSDSIAGGPAHGPGGTGRAGPGPPARPPGRGGPHPARGRGLGAPSRRALCTACGLRRGRDPDDSDTAISACPARCGRRPRAAGGAAAASRARHGRPT